jgi:hypothetical protein
MFVVAVMLIAEAVLYTVEHRERHTDAAESMRACTLLNACTATALQSVQQVVQLHSYQMLNSCNALIPHHH